MPPKKKKKENKSDAPEEETKVEKTQVVSKKRVVYAEIDDEVTEIYNRIHKIRAKHIYVVVPKRSILFQSVVNLKILKRKAEDDKKKIYFITNDKNGVYLAGQVGIEVYNKANNEGKPALFSTDTDDEKLRITPLKATVNSVEEDTPTRLKERKISIGEILRRGKTKKTLDVAKIQKQAQKQKEKKKKKSKFVVVAPNRHALIALSAVTVFILLIVVYVALPGVTIYITPSASVLEETVNITLADYNKNRVELETRPPHMIASYPIDTKISKSITHFSTGKKFSERGASSTGKITIYNTTTSPWPLIEETRFQTNDGIVFRIKDKITVPAASGGAPGQIGAVVVADAEDAHGKITGERGNIEPSRFFLPGLKESSQDKVYAQSSEPMTGGITDYVTYVAPEDIEAATSRLNDELMKGAVEALKADIIQQSTLVGDPDLYSLLEGDGAIKISETTVNVEPGLEGSEVTEFTLSGEITVSGVYYEHDDMLEILKSELLVKKSPQKELLRINENSTSYRIFEWDEYGGKIKLTANIKGIEQFEIDPDKENGQRLLEKIRSHVAGKAIDEAETFIQNLPEVNKVEIDSWPAWSPTIPNLEDNIEFEIRDALLVE